MSRFLGIDPGKKGAVAVWDTDMELLTVHDMPLNVLGDICGRKLAELVQPPFKAAVVERVGSMPKDGHMNSFTFGMGFGVVLGVLEALGVVYRLVHPAVWKGIAGVTFDKSSSIKQALATFPESKHYFQRKKDDGRAEAALLAKIAADRFGRL